jgi:AcrR family transcriptional regulator
MPTASSKQRVRRRLTPEARRALINEAATEIFARHGYDSATLQEIASAAGVVTSVIYLHYSSKEELYLKLLEQHSRALRERTIHAPRSSDLRREVHRVIDDFFSTLERDTFLWRTMFRDSPIEPTIAVAHARLQAKASEAITAVIGGGAAMTQSDAPAVDSSAPNMMAEMVKGALNGLAHWWWDHREVDRETVVDTATAVLWEGMSKMTGAEGHSS